VSRGKIKESMEKLIPFGSDLFRIAEEKGNNNFLMENIEG